MDDAVSPISSMEVQTKTMEMLQVAAQQHVTRAMLEHARVDVDDTYSFLADMLAIRITGFVLADRLLSDEKNFYFSDVPVDVTVTDRHWKWGLIPQSRQRSITVPASGIVKVRAEHFATFPEIDGKYYPEDMGRPVRLSQLRQR